MKLLLVAATRAELNQVFDYYNLPNDGFVSQGKFDILITGVGMTATAFALGKHLNNNYNLVLNVGIAGSFDPNISLGSLLNIERDTFAELGAEDYESFLTIDQLGLGENTYSATYIFDELPKVTGITVNRVHGNATSIAKTLSKFKPQTESMEGAAVFYACQMNRIPCLQVRAISNYVEPRNKGNWQIDLAIHNLNNWVISFIKNKL